MHPKPRFEELDFRQTPLGELVLRRRTLLSLDGLEVYEVILGEDHLMSSLFTTVEIALARLGLAQATAAFPGHELDVVVGGLGLGYTARAALQEPVVRALWVVDYLQPIIEWHRAGLVPLGKELTADPRCRFVHADFFALAFADDESFDPDDASRRFHAVLLDIDHSPTNVLHERHAAFYQDAGLAKLASRIHPGGVFALWSDDPPDTTFLDSLKRTFKNVVAHIVTFHNPLLERDSASTVYVAQVR